MLMWSVLIVLTHTHIYIYIKRLLLHRVNMRVIEQGVVRDMKRCWQELFRSEYILTHEAREFWKAEPYYPD